MSGLNRPTLAEFEALRVRARDVYTFIRDCDVTSTDHWRNCPEFEILWEVIPDSPGAQAHLSYDRLIRLHRALLALGRESRIRYAALGEECGWENATAWDGECAGLIEPQRRVVSNEAWADQIAGWLTMAESWTEEGCPEPCEDTGTATCSDDLPDVIALVDWKASDAFNLGATCNGTVTSVHSFRGVNFPAYLTLSELEACVYEGQMWYQQLIPTENEGEWTDPVELGVRLEIGTNFWEDGTLAGWVLTVDGQKPSIKVVGEDPFGAYAKDYCNEEVITSIRERVFAFIE